MKSHASELHRIFLFSMRCDIGLIAVKKSNYQAAIKAHLGGKRGAFIFQVYIIVVIEDNFSNSYEMEFEFNAASSSDDEEVSDSGSTDLNIIELDL